MRKQIGSDIPTVDEARKSFRPVRKSLPHEVPSWIDPGEETYFITIGCRERGANSLCEPMIARDLLSSAALRHGAGHWFIHLFLLMPDHLHALLSFPQSVRGIQSTIRAWKSWAAKRTGVVWQRSYFEHRLRSDESSAEKFAYILANPVRANLVVAEDEWPWMLWSNARGGPLFQGWGAGAPPFSG